MVGLTDIEIDEELIQQLNELHSIYQTMGLGRIPSLFKAMAGFLLSSTLYAWLIAELDEVLSRESYPIVEYTLKCETDLGGHLQECHLQQQVIDYGFFSDNQTHEEAMNARITMLQCFGAAFVLHQTQNQWMPLYNTLKNLVSPLWSNSLGQQLHYNLARLETHLSQQITRSQIDPLTECLLDFFHNHAFEGTPAEVHKFLNMAQDKIPQDYFSLDETRLSSDNVEHLRTYLIQKAHHQQAPSPTL